MGGWGHAMPVGGTRDQRVRRIALTLGVGGACFSALGAFALAFGQQQHSDFLRGVGTGLLATLPLFFGVMMIRAMQSMDEYGRQRQTQAASVAFLVVMGLAGSLMALEAGLGFHTPAWVYYTAGMLSWGLTAALLSARDRGTA